MKRILVATVLVGLLLVTTVNAGFVMQPEPKIKKFDGGTFTRKEVAAEEPSKKEVDGNGRSRECTYLGGWTQNGYIITKNCHEPKSFELLHWFLFKKNGR